MKWTQERIDKFKADPWSQLAKRNPIAFLVVLFLCILGCTMILVEIAGWSSAGWPKYFCAIVAAGGGLLGTRLRWKGIENAERNANKIRIRTDSSLRESDSL